MRIGLYLGFAPEGGGAFQYAQSILDAAVCLPAAEYDVVVAFAHPSWANLLRRHGTRLDAVELRATAFDSCVRWALRFGFPLRLWRSVAALVHPLTKTLLRQNCAFWIFPAQEVWTYGLPAKTIGVIHDLMHRHEPRFEEVSGWGLYRRRERHYTRLCAHARAVLVDSELGLRHVCDAYSIARDRVKVLPFAAPDYIRTDPPAPEFEARYSLPRIFLFYPAQFWEHKNHVRLLKALAIARREVPDLHLVLAGSKKNAYDNVLGVMRELGLEDRVHLVGYVPDADMAGFYRRARALIMPTFFGPTNIPPLEAMALGCPMAISRIYAMPDQVGDAAMFFDPASTAEIADAIVRLGNDDALCARLAASGLQRAKQWGKPQFNERFHEIVQNLRVPE